MDLGRGRRQAGGSSPTSNILTSDNVLLCKLTGVDSKGLIGKSLIIPICSGLKLPYVGVIGWRADRV